VLKVSYHESIWRDSIHLSHLYVIYEVCLEVLAVRAGVTGRPRYRWVDNIKIYLQEIVWEFLDSIRLILDMDKE